MAALYKSEQVLPVANSRVSTEQSLFTLALYLPVLGQFQVNISCGDQQASLSLHVVAGQGSTLRLAP